MSEVAKKSRWKKTRKFFNDVHLWLGLTSGLIVVAICLSGTIYVFNTELIEWSAPHLYKVEQVKGQQRLPADAFLAKVADASGGKITSVSIPADMTRSYQFNTRKEGDKSKGVLGYFVNPYTGEILGNTKEETGMKTLMGNMFSLHRWLLLDKIEHPLVAGKTNREIGSMISGWATILFTIGCITGLIIWIPNRVRSWKQGLKIKWKAGRKRLNHDLHNTLAFYSLFFLLLMGLTGPQWSFDWYRTGLQKTLGTYKAKEVKQNKPAVAAGQKDEGATPPFLISDFIARADKDLAYAGNYLVTMPAAADSELTISKTKTGFFAPAAPDRLTYKLAGGELAKKDVFSERPFNERIAGSIKAIHIGNVYGTFTKWIYFITCLVATTLPITGTLIWLNKLRKKRRRKASRQFRAVTFDRGSRVAVER